MSQVKFSPESIIDLQGKVFVITGGTAGLGKETVLSLAKHKPAHIYFTGRSEVKAKSVISEVEPFQDLTFIPCDLASLESTATSARQITSVGPRVDVVMCNAGIILPPAGVSVDGYEINFATNHMGHALFIQRLIPSLLQATDPRIVILSSNGHANHPRAGIEFDTIHTPQEHFFFGAWARYGQSKYANLLYAAALAKQYPAITSVAVHPGIVYTDMIGNMGLFNRAMLWVEAMGSFSTPEEGAYNQLWAATTDTKELVNGAYYVPVAKLVKSPFASEELAQKLWEWTQSELNKHNF